MADMVVHNLREFVLRQGPKLRDVRIDIAREGENRGWVTLSRGGETLTLSADQFRRQVQETRGVLDAIVATNGQGSELSGPTPRDAAAFSAELAGALVNVNNVAPARMAVPSGASPAIGPQSRQSGQQSGAADRRQALRDFISRNDGKLHEVVVNITENGPNRGQVTIARGSDRVVLSADEFRAQVDDVRAQLDRMAAANRTPTERRDAGWLSTQLGSTAAAVNRIAESIPAPANEDKMPKPPALDPQAMAAVDKAKRDLQPVVPRQEAVTPEMDETQRGQIMRTAIVASETTRGR